MNSLFALRLVPKHNAPLLRHYKQPAFGNLRKNTSQQICKFLKDTKDQI